MAKQGKIYIIGHKNPDTDSICSAIAYADIKNRLNAGKKYAAKRAGQINEETEYVLKRFGVEAPGYLSDVGTQVKDMEIRETPGVPNNISIKDAWAIMKKFILYALLSGSLISSLTVFKVYQPIMNKL